MTGMFAAMLPRTQHESCTAMNFTSPALRLGGWSTTAVKLAAGVLAASLVGCAGTSAPIQLYQLRAAPPVAVAAVAAAATVVPVVPVTPAVAPTPAVWQLAMPVRVPDYLDRDAVLVPQGQAGLQALPGQRWAEPLRESVPRLLRADLAALLGEARVWSAPLPAGVQVTRLLRVELLALESNAERSAVVLRARWSISDPNGRAAPEAHSAAFDVPSAGLEVDSLVAAHRMALWRLAERIAGVTVSNNR
jgi:uncharacterized protein